MCVRACVEEVGCQTWRDRRCNRRYSKCSGGGGGGGLGVVVRSQAPVCARGSNPQCPGACARLHVCRGQARETIARTRRKPMHYQPTPPFKRQHEESGISARCQPGARSLVRSIGTLQLYSCMLKLLKVQSMRAPRAERFGACNIPSNMPHGKKKKYTAR